LSKMTFPCQGGWFWCLFFDRQLPRTKGMSDLWFPRPGEHLADLNFPDVVGRRIVYALVQFFVGRVPFPPMFAGVCTCSPGPPLDLANSFDLSPPPRGTVLVVTPLCPFSGRLGMLSLNFPPTRGPSLEFSLLNTT